MLWAIGRPRACKKVTQSFLFGDVVFETKNVHEAKPKIKITKVQDRQFKVP